MGYAFFSTLVLYWLTAGGHAEKDCEDSDCSGHFAQFLQLRSETSVNHPWPHARGAFQSGFTPEAGSGFQPSWSYSDPKGKYHDVFAGGPVIDREENLYQMTAKGLFAFNSRGERLWHYATPGESTNEPCLSGELLLGSTRTGNAFAVDRLTGKELWVSSVADSAGSECGYPNAYDGVFVMGAVHNYEFGADDGNRRIYALNVSDGKKLWDYEPDRPVWNFTPLFPGDGTVVFMDFAGGVYRLKLTTGEEIWRNLPADSRESYTDGGAGLGENMVYTCSNYLNGTGRQNSSGIIRAFHLHDGREVWSQITMPCNSYPAIGHISGFDGESVVVTPGAFMGVSENRGSVIAFDALTGEEHWRLEVEAMDGWGAGEMEGLEIRRAEGVQPWCGPAQWSAPMVFSCGMVAVGRSDGKQYGILGPNASWTGPRTPGMTVAGMPYGRVAQATPMGSAFLHGALAAAPKMLAVSTYALPRAKVRGAFCFLINLACKAPVSMLQSPVPVDRFALDVYPATSELSLAMCNVICAVPSNMVTRSPRSPGFHVDTPTPFVSCCRVCFIRYVQHPGKPLQPSDRQLAMMPILQDARRPSTLAAICIHFSRLRPSEHKPTEKFLQRILWRADRLIYDLAGRELLSLLEVFALRGLREHDPRRPDLFIEAVPRLQKEVWDFGLSDVRRIAALYKQLNLRHEGLFEALGQRLEELLEETRTSVQKQNTQLTRQKRAPAGTAASAAVMTFLGACGRLNIVPLQAQNLLEVVGPTARAKKDLPRLAALAQLAAKFGCADTGEANRILLFVSAAFEEAVPDLPTRKGYASQAVYGQLLLALIFDESRCEIRDRTLVASVQAVFATFGSALDSLDERLARQLQVVDLACRVERPGVLEILETKGLTPFLEGVKSLEEIPSVLPKCSSQQHLQVSGVLQELGVKHRMEEKLQPYIADVRLTRRQRLIEIDGPLHFVGGSKRYDMKTSLKHRLLTKQGWDVHHIAWNDWPVQHHSRLNYVARLLRSSAPGGRRDEFVADG
ncbi:Tetrathionate hydrolase (4THase) (TTH) [Durusdinium trenchii]|uniref:Tetrathionate hydrolase (4THase) (TTH) n=1 Tax=Durusdinium trenchii TaxID=1381693 RepID=A0ABP0MKX7_9DINO